MTAATSGSRLLERLAGLTDHERSRDFHGGRVRLDLSRMECLLATLPPLPWPAVSVHVAGSEGKTSTTELIAAGLSAHGLLTATYTSPHLIDVRERLRIGGAFPPEPLLDAAVDVVAAGAARVGLQPSFFEFLTAVARVLYAQAGADAVVWETGLGGRLDATRLMQVDACVITSISLEHTAILGSTVPAIAAEKAGILRPATPVILGADVPVEARAVIEEHAQALACPVVSALPLEPGGSDFRVRNRALALTTLQVLARRGLVPEPGPAVEEALSAYAVAGRLQRAGNVLFDGAHTAAACRALARVLPAALAGARPVCIVFGTTTGRDPGPMLEPLLPLADALIVTRAPGDRGVDPADIAARASDARVRVVEEPVRALAAARELVGAGGLVVVTGSLYLVGHLLGSTCS